MKAVVITREQAKMLGMLLFFSGRPCRRGHIDERRVDNGSCVECLRVRATEWYGENLGRARKSRSDYYDNHRAEFRENCRIWQRNNPKKKAEYARRWRQKNPGKVTASVVARNARKLQATLPGYDQELIGVYERCPDGCQVDHIIPLRHELVCGLHVPWNLQYLTKAENLAKGNQFEPFEQVLQP